MKGLKRKSIILYDFPKNLNGFWKTLKPLLKTNISKNCICTNCHILAFVIFPQIVSHKTGGIYVQIPRTDIVDKFALSCTRSVMNRLSELIICGKTSMFVWMIIISGLSDMHW
jgi:hypothetical protein